MNIKFDKNSSGESIISFYPDIIPAEEGHPTSAKFFVKDTEDDRGKGLRGKVLRF